MWPKVGTNSPKSWPNCGLSAFSSPCIERGKILLNWYFISVDYTVYNTQITTASFRHGRVEWPQIEVKMRPMLFKKSWNLFYSNGIVRPVKLAWFTQNQLQVVYSYFLVCFFQSCDFTSCHGHKSVKSSLEIYSKKT